MIYLDNAATIWPKPDAVASAMVAALGGATSPARGAHELALEAGRILWRTRAAVSGLFGVDADRVVLTSGATAALNLAIAGLLAAGDHAITTDLEHNSVLRPLYAARARGVELTVVASERGLVSPDAVAAALRPSTRLVVVTHASNVLGTVQPVAEIARVCADAGVLCLVDAAQTAGLVPLTGLGASAIACSGHKSLLGPAGTGLLALAAGVTPRPLVVGGTGEDTFNEAMPDALPAALEAGTPNVPGFAGLLAALSEGGDHLAPAMAATRRLREGLAATGRVRWTETAEPGVPMLSCTITDAAGDLDSADAADRLAQLGIAVRGGYHCAPLTHRRYAPASGLVRFSPSHLTTDADIDATVAAVERL